MQRTPLESELNAGATAVVVAVTKDKIVCANAGDSRAALWQNSKCVQLSFDHKPENPI
jgi:serine/threonine protein phosphatase PrpC